MRFQQLIKSEKKVDLDVKDKKILLALFEDSRAPMTQIAKKVGLSRDSVKYRIDQLTKKGVIQGYRTAIDITKFGYEAYHIFLQLNKPSEEVEKKLITSFKQHHFVRAIIKFSGKYDFEIALVAKNVKELDEELNQIINDCGNYLQEHELLIITEVYVRNVFPKKFLKKDEKIETSHRPAKKAKFKTDKKDIQILDILSDDANLPLYKVAEKTGLSVDAVNYRIKRMKDAGIILKFVPVINYSVIGYSVYAILLSLQNLTPQKEAKIKQFINSDENMLWAVKTIGKYNFLFYICTKNPEDLHEMLIKLRTEYPENIKGYETLIAYEEYKYTYFSKKLL